jgi:hypothetical protein
VSQGWTATPILAPPPLQTLVWRRWVFDGFRES